MLCCVKLPVSVFCPLWNRIYFLMPLLTWCYETPGESILPCNTIREFFSESILSSEKFAVSNCNLSLYSSPLCVDSDSEGSALKWLLQLSSKASHSSQSSLTPHCFPSPVMSPVVLSGVLGLPMTISAPSTQNSTAQPS